MTESDLHVDVSNGVLTLTLDRAATGNAATPAMISGLVDALGRAALDDDVRVVLLTGSGPHFCAGIDLGRANDDAHRGHRPGHNGARMAAGSNHLLRLLQELQLPVVAAVRGTAAGFGCALALSADYVVAARTARFWTPFVARGFSPDSGTTFLLPRLIGVARAKEMLLLGRPVDGERAADWGLVNEAVDEEEVDARAAAVVGELAEAATVAVGLARTLVHRALTSDFSQALAEERVAVEVAIRTRDFKEGMAAFADRRPPRYEGR